MTGLRKLIRHEIESGKTQQELALQIGVSQGTVSNAYSGIIPRKIEVLEKFASFFRVSVEDLRGKTGHAQHVAEPPAPYGQAHRLLELAKQLDPEELATLERCAQAFIVEDRDVRLHLIGQLKLIERMIKGTKPARIRASPQKDKGTASNG